MYSGAKGAEASRPIWNGGIPASAPGTAGADTLCQPLARLRAGGRNAPVPYVLRRPGGLRSISSGGSLAGFQQRHLAAGAVEYGAECA